MAELGYLYLVCTFCRISALTICNIVDRDGIILRSLDFTNSKDNIRLMVYMHKKIYIYYVLGTKDERSLFRLPRVIGKGQ